ncbi:TRAP transporter substrate-binding protein [Natribacillus halophilus]|uniref:Tripartite ATP-independent transporter solute receptor, DctP family n=1 Tax=Natribacillus halophilus TaxID=549003 RepID=A0A1G8PAY7_9BACI|nr:TRAP transporter substrate-binding protein [Natribacillus halophilus]SDI89683.1 tripartite ATP-independent transporter solute receptor, DctP family [Natribacillus halophilus]
MKIKLNCLTMMLFMSLLIGCGQETASESNGDEGIDEKTLRLSHVASMDDPTHSAAEFYAERVEELSDGQITIDVFPDNQLGEPEEVAEQVRMGSIDMSIAASGQMTQWVPEFAAVQLPFLFEDTEHAYNTLDGEGGDMLYELAREENFEILSQWELGFRVISNNHNPIETPEDMEGVQIRVPPEVTMEAAMTSLGAVPEQVSFGELYMSLSQGVIDGQENPLHYIYTNAFHEVQDYITVMGEGYMYSSFPHIVNLDLWEGMNDEEREILKQASEEARDFNREEVGQTMDEAAENMEAEGVEINYVDAGDFEQEMEPAWNEIAEFAGEDFVENWLEVVEESAN